MDIGFEDFYNQPEVIVNEINSNYRINGFTSYTFDFDVECTVRNMDQRDVVIDEVEYIVYIEGHPSETHWYSHTYSTNLAIEGNGQKDLTLPVTLNLNMIQGAALVLAIADGSIDYVIVGTFHVISVDGITVDFNLPLYVEGSASPLLIKIKKTKR